MIMFRKRPTGLQATTLLEEDKRATTNMQSGLVFLFLFSPKKNLNFKKSPGEKF